MNSLTYLKKINKLSHSMDIGGLFYKTIMIVSDNRK
jgi:hypothetical protein